MAVEFDASELRAFAATVGRGTERVSKDVDGIIRKGALQVKKQLQAEAQGVAHAPGFPASITYEVNASARGVEAEIGPREGGAGSLALLYFGNSKSGPRLPDPKGALDRESSNVEKFILDAMGDVL